MKRFGILTLVLAFCLIFNNVTAFAADTETAVSEEAAEDGAADLAEEPEDAALSEAADPDDDSSVSADAEDAAEEDVSEEAGTGEDDPAEPYYGVSEEDLETDAEPGETPAGTAETEVSADNTDAGYPEDADAEDITEGGPDDTDIPGETPEADEAGDDEGDTVNTEDETIIADDESDEDMETVTEDAEKAAKEQKIGAFVTRCYRLILGREPDETGFAHWTEGIINGRFAGTDILKGFIYSQEYVNGGHSDSDYVTMLYNTVLDRSPDQTGFADWTLKLKQNFTRKYVLRGFAGSKEFKALCESYGMQAGSVALSDTLDLNPKATVYTYDLYNAVLKKAPDRSSHKSYVTKLLNNGARYVIATMFNSSAYKNLKTSDADFVQGVFRAALKRDAESGAVSSRVTMLTNNLSRMYVLKGVLGSSEFVNKVAKAGVPTGTFPDQLLAYRDAYPKATEFISKSYRNALGRSASATEVNKRLDQLITEKMPVTKYLYSIITSSEFNNKHTTIYSTVKALYPVMLQRSATSTEINNGVAAYQSSSKAKVFYSIADTREYYNKCAEYGFDVDYVYRKTASESFAEENIIKAILTKNPCYVYDGIITVRGLMLHSVGCSQPSAQYFVNNWNSASYDRACVHGFIDANSGLTYQTLPWNHRGWHAGGSANNTHIGVEMCESSYIRYTGGATFEVLDEAKARASAQLTYESAVHLFAMLCNEFDLNPLQYGVIISHNEGGKMGVASGHVDPEHYWTQLGLDYTMDGFRQDVADYLKYFR